MSRFYVVWGIGIFWLVFSIALQLQGKPSDTQIIIANVFFAASFLVGSRS